jgi:hypothetical protein
MPTLPIIPMIAIGVGVVLLISFFIIFRKMKTKGGRRKDTLPPEKATANEFINIRDIKGSFLYHRDGKVSAFVRVSPISIDLYSRSESALLRKGLTADFSSFSFPWKFIAASRPVDISGVITGLGDLLAEATDPRQRALLRAELEEMSVFAMSGETYEREFYFQVWDLADENAEKELRKKANSIESAFTAQGISTNLLTEPEIIKLTNLIHNPAYAHLEDGEITSVIPFIAEKERERR